MAEVNSYQQSLQGTAAPDLENSSFLSENVSSGDDLVRITGQISETPSNSKNPITVGELELRSSSESNSSTSGVIQRNTKRPDEETSKTMSSHLAEIGLRIPQEYGRLESLLSQIPKKAQHGLLMQCDLFLTCIDANDNFIALGTNVGLTFLYNRKDQSMQRLRSEASSDVVTCIRLHHGVDHQLAIGMSTGALRIYLIPGYLSAHKQQLQKFDVHSVHRHYVTCVEWSTNGMKLFSGDKTGHVVCTEIDFYQGECKSSLLLVESPTEIVQLHYDHKTLLISSRHRSFVFRQDTGIFQIGQQERKQQGNFGACFISGLCKVDDAKLYAARPGLRLWLSDIHGNVSNTLLFRDKINAGIKEISILRPAKILSTNAEVQFGRLYMYRNKQLVTYSPSTLIILDPEKNQVIASQSKFGGIVDLAINGSEIFVLRRHADDLVTRIAEEADKICNVAVATDIALSVAPSSGLAEHLVAAVSTLVTHPKEDKLSSKSSPTSFLKKSLTSPFKKLDNLIQERRHGKDSSPQSHQYSLENSASKHVDDSTSKDVEHRDVNITSELPPVVSLNSPDLAVHIFQIGPEEKLANDIQSPDSAHSALSVFEDELSTGKDGSNDGLSANVKILISSSSDDKRIEDLIPEKGSQHLGLIADRIQLNAGQTTSDIVFSHHRKKVKKKKTQNKVLDKDGDNISQASYSSQLSEGPISERLEADTHHFSSDLENSNEVSDIIRKAEEALISAEKLLHENKDSSEPSTMPPLIDGRNELTEADLAESVIEGTSQVMFIPDSDRHILMGVLQQHPLESNADDTLLDSEVNKSVGSLAKSNHIRPSELQILADSSQNTCTECSQDEHLKQVSKLGYTQTNLAEDPEAAVAAAEETLRSITKKAKAPDHKDDFYDMFPTPYTPIDHVESLSFTDENADQPRVSASAIPQGPSRQESWISTGSQDSERECTLQKLANNWSQHNTSTNIYSLGLSCTHIWFTDKSENLYYSALKESKGILWRKVGDPANQVSVSPSGHIVWRLHRGHVYAGTKITHRRPEGLKWVEAVRDVAYISVDDNCGWYVKTNGDVLMQRGLSKDRPCFRSLPVNTPCQMRQISAGHGVVWAISQERKLYVRTGITADVVQGLEWEEVQRQNQPLLFSSVSIDNEGIGWAIDVLGQIWFTNNVTPSNPQGSGQWWQTPHSEYFVQDATTLDMIRAIAKKFDPQKLSHILSTSRGGLIVADAQGVWLSLDYLNTLYFCRGSIQGYYWSHAHPSQMATATLWKQVHASIINLDWGLVWALQVNLELYALSTDCTDAVLVDSPNFASVCVNEHTVWGLTADGQVYVRLGMGTHCPQGAEWSRLDLTQLGDAHLVHLSCNSSYVWAVDAEGEVFQRIGACPPKPGQLCPVWLPIDTFSEIVFTEVVNGPHDWMVWAIDNRRLTYVRSGITDELPIGKEWVHVPGIQAMDLTLTETGVWALNANGEVLFRFGLSPNNVCGDYWKKIPGLCVKISASPKDMLWAVNTYGQLVKCCTHFLFRRQDSTELVKRSFSTGSEEGDWELV